MARRGPLSRVSWASLRAMVSSQCRLRYLIMGLSERWLLRVMSHQSSCERECLSAGHSTRSSHPSQLNTSSEQGMAKRRGQLRLRSMPSTSASPASRLTLISPVAVVSSSLMRQVCRAGTVTSCTLASFSPSIQTQSPNHHYLPIPMRIILALILLITTVAAVPHRRNAPLVPTFVTGWWSSSGAALPTGDELAAFKQVLSLPFNLVVLGETALAELVGSSRASNNTLFVEVKTTELTSSWYLTRAQELQKQGQPQPGNDRTSPLLAYSRVFLLAKAAEHETFNSDELLWVDPNALTNPVLQALLEANNVAALLQAFKHHFFLLTTPKDAVRHAFPNAAKTYFKTDIEHFVGSQLIGGRKEALPTMNLIYEDLVRVVLQFDANLWSEDAILSVLADRCPFLVSYLSADDLKPTAAPPRLLPSLDESRFADEKKQLELYEWLIGGSELVIVLIGCLLAWEVVRFLRFLKNRPQKLPKNDHDMESSNIVSEA